MATTLNLLSTGHHLRRNSSQGHIIGSLKTFILDELLSFTLGPNHTKLFSLDCCWSLGHGVSEEPLDTRNFRFLDLRLHYGSSMEPPLLRRHVPCSSKSLTMSIRQLDAF